MPHNPVFNSPIDNQTPERDAINYYAEVADDNVPGIGTRSKAVISSLRQWSDMADDKWLKMKNFSHTVGEMQQHLGHVQDYYYQRLPSMQARVVFSGAGGSGARARATFAAGRLRFVTILDPGSGYPEDVSVTIEGGNGTGATVAATVWRDGEIDTLTVASAGWGYTYHENWDYALPNGVASAVPFEPWTANGQQDRTGDWPGWVFADRAIAPFYDRGHIMQLEMELPEPMRGERCHGIAWQRPAYATNSSFVQAMQEGEVIAYDRNHEHFGGMIVIHQIDGRTVRYYGMNLTDPMFSGPYAIPHWEIGDRVYQRTNLGGIGQLNEGDDYRTLFIDVCTTAALDVNPYWWSSNEDDIAANFMHFDDLWIEQRWESDGRQFYGADQSAAPFDNDSPARMVIGLWTEYYAKALEATEPEITALRNSLNGLDTDVDDQILEMQRLDEALMDIRVAQTNMEMFHDGSLPDHWKVFRYRSPVNPYNRVFWEAPFNRVHYIDVTWGGKDFITPPQVTVTDSGDGHGAHGIASLTTGVTDIAIIDHGHGFTSAPDLAVDGGGGQGAEAVAEISSAVHHIVIDDWGWGYTEAPTVVLGGGGGHGAAAEAHVVQGVYDVAVESAGYGFTSVPDVVFNSATGSDAAATAVIAGEVESVDVDDAGSDYEDTPDVDFVGGGGHGAMGYATVTNGFLTRVTMTASGSGYTSVPAIVLSSGNAVATAIMRQVLLRVDIDDPGEGYEDVPTVTVDGGGGQGATVTASVDWVIERIDVTHPGEDYTSSPTVAIHSATGFGADAHAVLSGRVVRVTVTALGSSYEDAPTVTASGGGGTDAEFTASLSKVVRRVEVDMPGSGYSRDPVVEFVGGEGTGATATADVSHLYRWQDTYPVDDNIPGSYEAGKCQGVAMYMPEWARNRGNSVYAIMGGTLLYIGDDQMFGKTVVIQQDDAKVARYHRLVWLNPDLAAGQVVAQGSHIGHIGAGVYENTGDREAVLYIDIGIGHRLIDSPLLWDGADPLAITAHYADPLRLYAEGSIGPNPEAL